MTLGCGLSACKCLLGFFNFLIFVCGGTILGVGIWILVDAKSIVKILSASEELSNDPALKEYASTDVLHQTAYILIAAGVIVFLLGFLGCCGACMESKCMLGTYAVFLLIFLIVEIGAVIFAVVSKSKFEATAKKTLLASLKHYDGNDNGVTDTWNVIFRENQCCGVESPTDMKTKTKWGESSGFSLIPKGCCPNELCVMPYTRGCYDAFEDYFTKHRNTIIGAGVGVALVQFLAMIFAFCVCSAIRS